MEEPGGKTSGVGETNEGKNLHMEEVKRAKSSKCTSALKHCLKSILLLCCFFFAWCCMVRDKVKR